MGGLYGAFWTSAIEAGRTWTTLWDSRSEEFNALGFEPEGVAGGVVGDPMISPVAVARAVSSGRRVLMTRGEMVGNLSPLAHCEEPDCDAHQVSASDDVDYDELVDARGGGGIVDDWPGRPEDDEPEPMSSSVDQSTIDPETLEGFARNSAGRMPLRVLIDQVRRLQERSDLEFVLGLVERACGNLECVDLQRLDKSLRELYVRDALVSLAVTDMWADAEHLWTQATRRLRGRGQAAAATLLGFVHYVHGNGAMAGTAFDVALTASPGYSMAMLYNDALTRGIPPTVISRCAETGYIVARSLGVDLPPPVLRPAA